MKITSFVRKPYAQIEALLSGRTQRQYDLLLERMRLAWQRHPSLRGRIERVAAVVTAHQNDLTAGEAVAIVVCGPGCMFEPCPECSARLARQSGEACGCLPCEHPRRCTGCRAQVAPDEGDLCEDCELEDSQGD